MLIGRAHDVVIFKILLKVVVEGIFIDYIIIMLLAKLLLYYFRFQKPEWREEVAFIEGEFAFSLSLAVSLH
jgi:hypothetical protein